MFAKVAVFCTLLVAVSAGLIHGGLGGSSVSSRRQDDFGNYAFKYQIVNGAGATNGRAESGDAWGNVAGSYNIGDIDGRSRRVDYVADGAGFRAVVKTNEPGTAHSAPAASLTASTNPGHISASPAVIAHAPVAAIAAAPVALGGIVGAPALAGIAHGGIVGAAGLAHAGLVGAPGLAHAGLVGAPGLAHAGLVGAAGLGHAGIVHGGLGLAGVHGLGLKHHL